MFREAIEAFARGEIVVVTDDNDRENEGDLIIAAAHATPEKMAFIIRHTCGIVCAPLTGEIARRLHLAPMVADNDAIHGTAFTVSVDYRHGTTTGISAEERTATVRALANNNAGRADFVRPGHIFPLIAKDGGVLIRSGHTEAAVDLCRLADIEPVAAICELVNDDGTVMRGPQVAAFAKQHKLKRISVADLIAYRQAREKLVTRVAEFKVATRDRRIHRLRLCDAVRQGAPLRLCLRQDRRRAQRADPAAPRQCRRRRVRRRQADPRRARAASRRPGAACSSICATASSGVPTRAVGEEATASEIERSEQWREVGLGAQILRDLQISSIRLLATRSRTYVGLAGFGIEIAGTEPLE